MLVHVSSLIMPCTRIPPHMGRENPIYGHTEPIFTGLLQLLQNRRTPTSDCSCAVGHVLFPVINELVRAADRAAQIGSSSLPGSHVVSTVTAAVTRVAPRDLACVADAHPCCTLRLSVYFSFISLTACLLICTVCYTFSDVSWSAPFSGANSPCANRICSFSYSDC